MREEPSGAALLQAATTLIREDLLAALPDDKRHNALMIANAMSIAMRQLEYGGVPEEGEMIALRELLGIGAGDGGTGTPMRAMLASLNRELAQRIRCGQADPGAPLHAPVLAHLRSAARQRLLESSPKTLKARAA
ncbi:DUF6285 domain-containing protein [Massilia putida]|uniref:DUF6285 domain-containing protein n=1 Tax=Massilia putida TaxID=1141883 RepID=UPI000951F1DC|nr:DUF6285 domain-containing protein [Massilia putida]